MQHAAGVPLAAALQALEQAAGVAETADHQLRKRRPVGGQLEVEHALRIARRLFGEPGVAFDQRHLPAARGQAGGAGATGHAAADHQRLARAAVARRAGVPGLGGVVRRAAEFADQHLALLPVAFHPFHAEAGGDQPAADESGAGEGRQVGAGSGEPGHLLEQRVGPHLRVLRRGETVEEPGVDARIQLRQHVQHVVQQQGENHPPAGEHQALEAGMDADVLLQQRVGPGLQLRPEGQGALQVGQGEGEFFHADEVQARIRRGQLLEQRPGAEEVQAGAEAGLADAQAAAGGQFGKAPGQAVAVEEHVARLLQAAGAGEVDVAVDAGGGLAVFVPVELGGLEIWHARVRAEKRAF
ncbi:hypothetical protein D9M71_411080 [compost metagenome]